MSKECEDERRLQAMLDGILGGSEPVRREAPLVGSVAINFNAPVVLVGDAASARACMDGWVQATKRAGQ